MPCSPIPKVSRSHAKEKHSPSPTNSWDSIFVGAGCPVPGSLGSTVVPAQQLLPQRGSAEQQLDPCLEAQGEERWLRVQTPESVHLGA